MTNSPYTSSSFLTSGSENLNYNELDYNEKIKIKALEGLDQLAANLNAIANIKAIEFQINHLNSMTTGFTDQLTAKDNEIAHLQSQLNAIDATHAQQLAALQAQIAELQAANASLTENFNKFKSVLTSIDQITDEVIS